MTDIAIQQYLQDFAAGVSQTFTASGGDYIKCRSQVPNPAEDSTGQVAFKISINDSPETDFIVGVNMKPDQRIKKIRVRNPNGFAVRCNFTIGRGDITDDLVIFDSQGGALTVQLQEDSQVRVDANFTEANPIHTTLSGIHKALIGGDGANLQYALATSISGVGNYPRYDALGSDKEGVENNALNVNLAHDTRNINSAAGHILLPPRKKAIFPSSLLTGGGRERGGAVYHNGIQGQLVNVDNPSYPSTLVNPAGGDHFYCPEFIGQAEVFGTHTRRRKLTIKAENRGVLLSRIPFYLGRTNFTSLGEYIDEVLCALGGFIPTVVQTWDIRTASRQNRIQQSQAIALDARLKCDNANTGGLVGGIPSGLGGVANWGSGVSGEVVAVGQTINDQKAGQGVYVSAPPAYYLRQGETISFEDHAPIFALSADNFETISSTDIQALDVTRFSWREEFYVDTPLT